MHATCGSSPRPPVSGLPCALGEGYLATPISVLACDNRHPAIPFHSNAAMSHIVKRKADELDESDDEEEPTLGRQVLPVANLPDTFDGVPADGMQYLFTVR